MMSGNNILIKEKIDIIGRESFYIEVDGVEIKNVQSCSYITEVEGLPIVNIQLVPKEIEVKIIKG